MLCKSYNLAPYRHTINRGMAIWRGYNLQWKKTSQPKRIDCHLSCCILTFFLVSLFLVYLWRMSFSLSRFLSPAIILPVLYSIKWTVSSTDFLNSSHRLTGYDYQWTICVLPSEGKGTLSNNGATNKKKMYTA